MTNGTLVGPRDCALAIAVPLSRRAFMNDLCTDGGRDLPKLERSRTEFRVPGSSARMCWSEYRPVVKTALRVSREARRLGVTVVLDATASDLRRLIDRFLVVTFISHWAQNLIVLPEDILDESALRQHLCGHFHIATDPVRRVYLESLAAEWATYVSVHGDRGGKDELSRFLSGLLQREQDEKPAEQPDSRFNTHGPFIRFYRLDLELVLDGMIRPAPVVDFGDGFKPASVLLDAVPECFSSVLDLGTCYSNIVGETIKRGRPGRRDGVVIVGGKTTFIQLQLSLYLMTIRALGRNPASFVDTLSKVRAKVIDKQQTRITMPRQLRSILLDTWQRTQPVVSFSQGGGPQSHTVPLSAGDAQLLETDLRAALGANKKTFWAAVVVTIALIVFMMATTWRNAQSDQSTAWLKGIVGVPIVALLFYLIRLWREVTALELMVILASRLQGQALTDLIEVVLKRLKPWGLK